MGTVVRTGSGVLVCVACLLLPFSATDTGKTHPRGLKRWSFWVGGRTWRRGQEWGRDREVGSLLREGALCSVQLFTRMPRVEHPLWAGATIQVMLPISFFIMIKYKKHKIYHFDHF